MSIKRILCAVVILASVAFAAVQVKPTTNVATEQADVVSQQSVHHLFFDGYKGQVLAIYTPSKHVTDDLAAIKARGFDGIVLKQAAPYTRKVARREHLTVARSAAITINKMGDCGKQFFRGVVNADHTILNSSVKSIALDWNMIVRGVDTCSYLTAGIDGKQLWFRSNAPVPAVNKYVVFISKNGDDLMPLVEIAPSSNTLDLGSFYLTGGRYYIYVKQVGQPLVQNRLSSAMEYVAQ